MKDGNRKFPCNVQMVTWKITELFVSKISKYYEFENLKCPNGPQSEYIIKPEKLCRGFQKKASLRGICGDREGSSN